MVLSRNSPSTSDYFFTDGTLIFIFLIGSGDIILSRDIELGVLVKIGSSIGGECDGSII